MTNRGKKIKPVLIENPYDQGHIDKGPSRVI